MSDLLPWKITVPVKSEHDQRCIRMAAQHPDRPGGAVSPPFGIYRGTAAGLAVRSS